MTQHVKILYYPFLKTIDPNIFHTATPVTKTNVQKYNIALDKSFKVALLHFHEDLVPPLRGILYM